MAGVEQGCVLGNGCSFLECDVDDCWSKFGAVDGDDGWCQRLPVDVSSDRAVNTMNEEAGRVGCAGRVL